MLAGQRVKNPLLIHLGGHAARVIRRHALFQDGQEAVHKLGLATEPQRIDGRGARHLVLIKQTPAIVTNQVAKAHQRQYVQHVIDQSVLTL